MIKIDLNADIGESLGRYTIGDDKALMEYVTSVSIACGFHAGDPNVMENVTKSAAKKKLNIGAHPGLPDIMGFGRRAMQISSEDLKNYVTYQIGALDAFLKRYNQKVMYIKPHGAMYRMVEESEEYAEALCYSILGYNPELALITENGKVSERIAMKHGIKVVREGFPDLDYDESGNWVIERNKRVRTPEEVAERAIEMILKKRVKQLDGKFKEMKVDTLCIHGDSPNAVEIANTVNSSLIKNNIHVYGF